MRDTYVTCCDLSPWMVVAGNWFWHNQYSNASAPLLVSTKTKVRECCKTKGKNISPQTQITSKGWELGKKKSNFESIFKPYWLNYTKINWNGSLITKHNSTFPWVPFALCAWRRSIRWLLLSDSRTNSTLWTIRSVLEPTLPTARKM